MRAKNGIILILSVFLALSMFVSRGMCSANEQQKKIELTLNQAVEMALKESVTLKQAELGEDRARKVAENAWDAHNLQLRATYDEASQLYASVPVDQDAFPLFFKADRGWRIAQRTYQITRDATELAAKKCYFDVLQASANLDAAKKAYEFNQSSLRSAQAMYQVGMNNAQTLELAKLGLQKSNLDLQSAKADLDKAYMALNQLIGLDPMARPVLIDAIPYEKLKVDSLDADVSRATRSEDNPALWIKKEQYEISRYLWSYTIPDSAGKIDIDKSYLEYDTARKTIRDKMYQLCDNIITLESSYNTALQNVKATEEKYRVEQLRYNVGMSTKKDVLEAEMLLEQAKLALKKVAAAHHLGKVTFEKPWLIQ